MFNALSAFFRRLNCAAQASEKGICYSYCSDNAVYYEEQRMDLKLTGKVALVTGSSTGIGAGVAIQLAKVSVVLVN